jgi:hypothetical protein
VLCNNIFYNICNVLSKQKNGYILPLVISAINKYETDNRFKNTELFKYHLLILNELERTNDEQGKNDRLINSGVHILLAFENLSNESMRNLTSLNRPLLMKSSQTVFNALKASTYQSCLQLTETLLNPNNYFLEQLKQLLQECLGRLELSELQPPEYRSKMYLIQAMIFKLENNAVQSLSSVHNALLSHPYDAVMISLLFFINHSNFHSTVRRELVNEISQNSLNLADIMPPTQIKNMNFLKRTERLIMLKKYERAIVKRIAENNPLQAAYSYIDLIMAISGSPTLLVSCFTMSCLYFYKAMTNSQCTSAELYAYRSIIFDLSVEIFLLTRHYLSLYVQMHIYKLLYTLILRSSDLFAKGIAVTKQNQTVNSEFLINDFHETILDELLKNIFQVAKVNPLTHVPPTSMIHDMIYMECAGNELLSKYIGLKSTTSSVYQYYYFEGVWKGWIDDEQFPDERQICMQALLCDNNWGMDDVEDLLCWSLLPRTDDGWLLSTKHQLRLEQPAYAQVIGITLNNDTGEIGFMFTKAKKTDHNLFDAADVVDVLRNGITFAYFTLDPPDTSYHSHPFNEMRYLPKRLSETPHYLLTLLHTDYLLKMISTGVEICSLKPFEMRSSITNLMQRLPAHIRDELQAIALTKSGILTDSIHRFWIQAESSLNYEQTFYKNFFGGTNENITHFYFDDNLKMCVKQHRMKYDEQGNLIDDKNDAEDDQSAEAQFAQTFTKYYDEIGQYFPELLRLKELLKLSVIARIIRARYESQCDLASRIEKDTALETFLKEIKRQIGRYPTGSEEADEKIVKSISNSLCKQFFCKKSTLKSYLIDWLRYDREQPLFTYVKQSLIEKKAKLKFMIEKLRLTYDDSHDNEQTMSSHSSQCSWVPAAFSSDLNMKVYGGVMANPNIQEKSGIEKIQKKSKTIVEVSGTKVVADRDKQTSKKGQDKNNNRKGKPVCFSSNQSFFWKIAKIY